jgi:DNA-binding HxlR family transcriptional regulator
MPDRSYQQHCPIAKALDVVGERWTLLIVRELMLGPLRYGDLQAGLPGIGTKVLAERLRSLAAADVLHSVRLPAPASADGYALTEKGFALGRTLDALAQWGAPRLGKPAKGDALAPSTIILMMCSRASSRAPVTDASRLGLSLDGEQFDMLLAPHGASAYRGEARHAGGFITMSTADAFALLGAELSVAQAVRQRRLEIGGTATAALLRQAFAFR